MFTKVRAPQPGLPEAGGSISQRQPFLSSWMVACSMLFSVTYHDCEIIYANTNIVEIVNLFVYVLDVVTPVPVKQNWECMFTDQISP